ncbi:hypothetical protein GCM10012282_10340 [Streptomyces lacrimifluminis]|uniref:Uncharacterized protein n=1 Tax=Streptomyces lacrimifluminis TaxID=1500077 RepID=A0A917KMS1_9ACTN|nr:hypothetical protein GCM10012282_10340 [Streptomyces lacrimifluminis]
MAMTSPVVTAMTVPGIWLRMLRLMAERLTGKKVRNVNLWGLYEAHASRAGRRVPVRPGTRASVSP